MTEAHTDQTNPGEAPTMKGADPGTPAPIDPFVSLKGEMDRLFDRFLGRPFPGGFGAEFRGWPFHGAVTSAGPVVPAMDVEDGEGAITVTADLPGLTEEEVEVHLDNRMLTIRGEKKAETGTAAPGKDGNGGLVERRYGSFERRLALPEGVDIDAVTAAMDKGVLTITVPKKPGASPKRRIAVNKAG